MAGVSSRLVTPSSCVMARAASKMTISALCRRQPSKNSKKGLSPPAEPMPEASWITCQVRQNAELSLKHKSIDWLRFKYRPPDQFLSENPCALARVQSKLELVRHTRVPSYVSCLTRSFPQVQSIDQGRIGCVYFIQQTVHSPALCSVSASTGPAVTGRSLS